MLNTLNKIKESLIHKQDPQDILNALPELPGEFSDGYHTFSELYEHRAILFQIICSQNKDIAWKSKLHHDGDMFENYFICGITTPEGEYTYRYPMSIWDKFDIKELPRAPEWDGHQPKDITRLLSIL